MNYAKNLFQRQGIKIALYLIIVLVLTDTVLTYRYKLALKQNVEAEAKLDKITAAKATILSNFNNADMSLRGYLLVQNEAFLATYDKIKQQSKPSMVFLEKNLPGIGIPVTSLTRMKQMLNNYFLLMDDVTLAAQMGNMEEALRIIKEDHGAAVGQTYMDLSKMVDPVIEQQRLESKEKYKSWLNVSLFFQAILFFVAVPTLLFTTVNLTRNQKKRIQLFKQLDEKNRTLIFNSNKTADIDNEDHVIEDIMTNLNKAAKFIKGITQGNYDVTWEGFNTAGAELNKNNISGELLFMRDEMKKKQQEGVRQQWVSEGLNKISEIIRDHQTNFEALCEKTVGFIVRYLNAQQGGLFILVDDNDDRHIALVSCYAFEKKKFVTKRIEIGEGILGQIFLEGEPVYLTQVPKDYVKITSGLGESNPRCMTIYPMKHNESVVALIEIASFVQFDQHALDFLANACKSIAASIVAIKSSAKTKTLLDKSQLQAEQMRAQEEEMRQNMEELEATQEEMKRRELDLRDGYEQRVAS